MGGIYGEICTKKGIYQRKWRLCGIILAILDIIAAIINEQYNQAEELLDTAKKMYDDPRLQKSFREILDILNKEKAENH